jgi:hypothetical protein
MEFDQNFTLSAASAGMNRRHFLRTAGLAGAALIFGVSSDAEAFLFQPKQSNEDLLRSLDIPLEWMQRLGPTLPEYARYLDRLKLRRVSVLQVIQPHTKKRGLVFNTLPPKSLWRNMGATLKVVDRLSETMNEPLVEIISAYRSPAYNAKCSGGKSNSQHLRNTALDLKYRCSPRMVSRTVRELREQGLFLGGVGRYSDFTHVDTRGRNADW